MKSLVKKLKRKYRDQFNLDTSREVLIDGHEMIIIGYSADAAYRNLSRLSVEFIPKSEYIARYKNG